MSVAGFALVPLKFGDRIIEPGEPVPYERGRNYISMTRLGQIAPYRKTGHDVEPKPRGARRKAQPGADSGDE